MDLQIYLVTSEFVMDTMTSITQTEYNVFQDRIYILFVFDRHTALGLKQILAEPILGHQA